MSSTRKIRARRIYRTRALGASYARATTLQAQGDLEGAQRLYRELLDVEGEHPDLLMSLGLLNCQLHRFDAAVGQLRKVVESDPQVAEHHGNLALALHKLGAHDEALLSFREALRLRPGHVDTHNNFGCLLLDLDDALAAIAQFEMALRQVPDHAATHFNLARALQRIPDAWGDSESAVPVGSTSGELEMKRYDRALELLYRAACQGPPYANEPRALADLAWALAMRWRVTEAMALLQCALEASPDSAAVWCSLGSVLARMGRDKEAIEAHARAIDLCLARRPIDPGSVNASAACHFMQALNLLMAGQWDDGWGEYEWRLLHFRSVRRYATPPWDGESLEGRTIYVYAEQGMGDAIQFVRFLPWVRARGGRVILECHPTLQRLFRTLDAADEVVNAGYSAGMRRRRKPRFDCHISLLSLPNILKITLQTLPAHVPYLVPPAEEVNRWRDRLATDALFKVGLVWAGNASMSDDRHRSCRLEQLAPLARIPGVSFYSLQKGPQANQPPPPGMKLIDLTADLTDFLDTAALVANLDLVVSVDTAVAHLAGALGRPVYTLVRFAPDWRWMREREDSPWYPTMRLFRQTRPMAWDDVVLRVANALATACGQSPSGTELPPDREVETTGSTPAVPGIPPGIARFLRDGKVPRTSFSLNVDPTHVTQKIIGDCQARGELYEPATSRCILAAVGPGDTVLDVGGHVGYFSLLCATLVGDEGRVIAFEPEATNVQALKANVRLNGFRNIVAVKALVGARAGHATFYYNADNDGGHALWDVGSHPFNRLSRDNPRKLRVRMVSLDQYLSTHVPGSVRLIKIDTEGAELEVLRGATAALSRLSVPYVIAEVNVWGLQQMGTSEDVLREFMEQQGYSAYILDDERPGELLAWSSGLRAQTSAVFNVLFSRPGRVEHLAGFTVVGCQAQRQ